MKICSSCGKQIAGNAVTCSYCGHGFKEEKPPFELNEEKVEKTVHKIGRGLSIIHGLPFLIIGMIMFFGFGSDALKYYLYKGEAIATYKEKESCVLYDGDIYETCDVVYAFDVNGKEYTYTEILVTMNESVDKEKNIIYSKMNPSNNIVNKGTPDYIGILMGVACFLAGIAAIFGKGEASVSVG